MSNEKRDWAVELARTASQKVGIYPGDRYHARDHDKFVYVIARLLRKAERRGYRRGVKVLAMALTSGPKERYDSIKSVRP